MHFLSAYINEMFCCTVVDKIHGTQRLQAGIYGKTNIIRIWDTYQARQQHFVKLWICVDSPDSDEIYFDLWVREITDISEF